MKDTLAVIFILLVIGLVAAGIILMSLVSIVREYFK